MIIMIYVKKKTKQKTTTTTTKKTGKKINELNKNTNERNAIYDFTETPLLPNKPPAGIKCHKKGHYYAKKKKAVVMTTA